MAVRGMKLKTADEYTGQPMRLVRAGEDFGRGQAAEVGEPVAQRAADGDERLDVANAVLEAHQVGAAVGQLQQRLGA